MKKGIKRKRFHIKRTLFAITAVALFWAGATAGDLTSLNKPLVASQTLTFNDLGLGGGGPSSGTYAPGQQFSFDVYLTFNGYNSSNFSFWLETNNAFAGSLSITGVTYGTTFSDPTQPNPTTVPFNSTNGASPGYMTETRDFGAYIVDFNNPPHPGTYFINHFTFSIAGGAAPGNYILQSTVISPHTSEATSYDGTNFAVNDLPAAQYMITIAVPNQVVSNTNDTGAGSLRQAVANAASGATITFNLPDGPHTVALGSEIATNKNLTINGPANGPLTLSGGNSHRIFNLGPGNTLLLSDMMLAFGHSEAGGGAVFNNGARLTINNCTLFGNSTSSSNGGALNNNGNGSIIKVTNSTFSANNAAGGDGGAIFNNTGTSLTLGNVTVTKNTASNGGGIMNLGTLNLKNSIVARNTAFTAGNNIFLGGGSATSSGYNMSDDTAGGVFTATGDQINTDPILGPLKDNGGLTPTHAPLSNSPAIDKGKDLGADGVATGRDQRGSLRPVTYNDPSIVPPAGGDRSDVGAVELPPGVIPTSAASVKSHGGTPFSIPLALTGPPAIECRSGGAANDYQVVLTFAGPVSYSSALVTSGAGSVPNITTSGNQVTLDLTGVTNAQTITVALFGVADGTNSGDVGIRMGMLLGDTGGNGTVNSTDISQTKLRSGQTADAVNFRSDVNASGSINATDVSTVKLRSGSSLP